MRFSVDAHTIGCHLTGNEVYVRNLLREFARLDDDAEFVAYYSKPQAPEHIPSHFTARQVSENPWVRLGYDLPQRLREDRPELLHVQYTAPLFCETPLVVTVHDVSYLEHPDYFPVFRRNQLRLTVANTVKRAAKVLTPSEFSRKAILKHYRIDPDKVDVVPNAVSSQFRPIDRQVAQRRLQESFGLEGSYVLAVGDLQPRKNHIGLLAAFEDVVRAHPQLKQKLVFVGKETWYSKEIHEAVNRSSIRDRVVFTGFVEDSDLLHFYAGCDLFVFPSFYEGFGLPILEAMACGRAVVCSKATAMPEVANACGILFDPDSKREMARAIRDVLLDAELRQKLERLGTGRASLFSWEAAARKTLDAYYQVARVPRRVPAALEARV